MTDSSKSWTGGFNREEDFENGLYPDGARSKVKISVCTFVFVRYGVFVKCECGFCDFCLLLLPPQFHPSRQNRSCNDFFFFFFVFIALLVKVFLTVLVRAKIFIDSVRILRHNLQLVNGCGGIMKRVLLAIVR